MGMIKRVVHNLDYEEIDKRENKRHYRRARSEEKISKDEDADRQKSDQQNNKTDES